MISVELIFFIILVIYAFSLFPSISVPYIIDDIDHLHHLVVAIKEHSVVEWLFRPHNEHVIPVIKSLYLISYTYFGLNPELFHLFVLAVCLGVAVLAYKLTLVFTKSTTCAIIALSLFTTSHLIDNAIFVGTNSHIIFCLFFFLLLFYALWQYSLTAKRSWRFAAFLSVLILPSTFALGLTSIIFIFLFYWLCMDGDQRQRIKTTLPLLATTWIFSLVPYIYGLNKIVHAEHYSNGGSNIYEIARFMVPLHFINTYIGSILIPSLLNNIYLSLGIFFLSALSIFCFPRQVSWKKVIFLLIFGLFNNFIIFVFRSAWGIPGLQLPRYFTFPLIMMALSYPLLLSPLIANNPAIKKFSTLNVTLVICLFFVACAGIHRYNQANRMLTETMLVQNLFVNFKKAFVNYTQQHPDIKRINVTNGDIKLPSVSLLRIDNGPVSFMLRFPSRQRRFLAEFLLPESINQKVHWGKTTDPDFLNYLKTNDYLFLTN